MYIRTDDDNNVVEIIFVGSKPKKNGYEIDNIDENIIKDILSYKYIDGKFIKNETDIYQKNINSIKNIKISRMSQICNKLIESGIDVNGSHYSLKQTDQMELIKLEYMLKINPDTEVLYHADGEKCRIYSSEEFLSISNKAFNWITYHRTYFNLLKSEILEMTDVNDVLAIKYGISLNDENNETLLSIMGDNTIECPVVEDTYNYKTMSPPKIDIRNIPRTK